MSSDYLVRLFGRKERFIDMKKNNKSDPSVDKGYALPFPQVPREAWQNVCDL